MERQVTNGIRAKNKSGGRYNGRLGIIRDAEKQGYELYEDDILGVRGDATVVTVK